MEFLLWFSERENALARDDQQCRTEMGKLSGELADQRKLKRGAPLAPVADAAAVRVRAGKALVSDGPYAEAKEIVGGFWIVDVASREEAIAIAKRTTHARYGTAEVHAISRRIIFKDSAAGTPFLFIFRREPGQADADGEKLREMIEFSEELASQGILIETAPLAIDPPPARVEVRGEKVLITDGPFAEAKEGVGGYGVLRLKDRAAAIALAKRYPHARWGPIEIRQIEFFDRV